MQFSLVCQRPAVTSQKKRKKKTTTKRKGVGCFDAHCSFTAAAVGGA